MNQFNHFFKLFLHVWSEICKKLFFWFFLFIQLWYVLVLCSCFSIQEEEAKD